MPSSLMLNSISSDLQFLAPDPLSLIPFSFFCWSSFLIASCHKPMSFDFGGANQPLAFSHDESLLPYPVLPFLLSLFPYPLSPIPYPLSLIPFSPALLLYLHQVLFHSL